jgi:hypothetical protein
VLEYIFIGGEAVMTKVYTVICREPENKSPQEEQRLLRELAAFDYRLRKRQAEELEAQKKQNAKK